MAADNNGSKILKWFKIVIVTAVLLELVYLVVFDVALNSVSVKQKVNDMDPGRFQLKWDSAWTFYPSRIHLENLSVSGTSGEKDWEADIQFATASVSLSSLLFHKIKICNVAIDNINYSSRKSESAQSHESQQSDTNETISQVKSGESEADADEYKGRHWDIELQGIKFRGHHKVAIDRLKGELDGTIITDLSVDTKENKLSLGDGTVDISIDRLHSASGDEIVKEAKLKGSFKIKPLDFKETRGSSVLKFLTFDASIDAQMQNLDVFDRQLHRIRKLRLNGNGAMTSHILFAEGKLLAGSMMQIDAKNLQIGRSPYSAEGDGRIELLVGKENPDVLDARITFGEYKAYEDEEQGKEKSKVTLFQGSGLEVYAKADSVIYQKPTKQID